ncbi:hypothetical protein GOV12_03870 [Candidatus Pacearchaeota archaeon]|nr:hypothetical protein [Candidatus Pacearchaeota archaeon]
MTDIKDLTGFLTTHTACSFVETICSQSIDRDSQGFQSENQLCIRGIDSGGKVVEEELLYHSGLDKDPMERFDREFDLPLKQYKERYSDLPVVSESNHQNEGIKRDQRRYRG